ncbi:hypothetical protein MKW98_025225 [Papaver atlanticum]|uniref:Uncharacterized protein n=1 Tax=Papaver atlanticum TaxID=357466 RepID=A0AAD4S1H8_9MAGN|nr:hypothetical protein MKW98_025225 [Papaver atlanticum]
MSRTIPYGSTFVPYTDHSVVPYGTPMVNSYELLFIFVLIQPTMVTAQGFGSTPTSTNPVSFSELLESNLNPWDLV